MSRLEKRLPPRIDPWRFKDRPLVELMDYARKIHLAYAAGRRSNYGRRWDEEWAKVYERVIAVLEGVES